MLLLLLGSLLHASLAAGVPALPTLVQAASRLVAGGAAVVVADAKSGAELYAGGFADEPMPPGSIFKLVTALASGYELPAALDRPRFCPPRTAPDQPDGHGWIGMEDALAHSCNRYFASLGRELGARRLLRTLSALGLMPAEAPPEVPAGELALGTGVLLTAHQQATLLRIVATGWMPPGKAPPPREVLLRIRQGLRKAVAEGTARAVAPRHIAVPVSGKTGTAFLHESTLGWFGGYAPVKDPQVLVIVGLRGKLGRDAARAARGIFEAYFAAGTVIRK